MALSGKTKNPKTGQATTNTLKSISRGKILSLTDVYGKELRKKKNVILIQIFFL